MTQIIRLVLLASLIATAARRADAACADPAAFGAIPDDGVSDRDAFQRALDSIAAGGTLCIGPGRWTMERAKPGTYNRFAALSTHGHGVTIAGVGPATVLELAGDQGGGATSVISVDPGAMGITIRDFAIDTTDATNADEQTHAIATSGNCSMALGTCRPITGLTITRITFTHPPAPDGGRKGDCIRLLGNTVATAVTDVTISGIVGAFCARAFVEIQRGLHHVTITGNQTTFCGDQCVDSEPTGDSTATDDDIVITDNRFDCADGSQGDSDVSLGGAGEPMRRVTMKRNTLCRGVRTYRIADSVISGNTIGGAMRGPGGVVEIGNVCSGLLVEDNTITRSGAPGPMVRAVPHSGGLCGQLTVRDNSMIQGTGGHGVWLESVSTSQIAGNSIQWTTPAPTAIGVYDRATLGRVTDLRVTDNVLIGSIGTAVMLSAAPYAFGEGVVVLGEMLDAGIECIGSGGFAPMEYEHGSVPSLGCP